MSVCTHILVLTVLQMGLVNCLSWDIIVVDAAKQLQFYTNGTLTLTEDIPSAKEIYSITYDPVHYRVLFVDNDIGIQKISSFDLSTKNVQPLVARKSSQYLKVAYDPVTQLLFWKEEDIRIFSFSLNPASSCTAVDVNFVIATDDYCNDIAVDSCRGYLYWITDFKIERARFDGSEREVLIVNTVYWRYCLTIDQQTQKMYWTEKLHSDDQISIESGDLNGKNRITLYTIKTETEAGSLTLSNHFIYWNGIHQKAIWQLPKTHTQNPTVKKAKTISDTYRFDWDVIAANYTIKEQLKNNQNCETLKSLIPDESEPECIDLKLCVHGTKVSGESHWECKQGYTGEKCDIFVCQNYCLHGNCSISAEGLPKCSCKAGYFGQRCEVNACHRYCLNSGVCSLNEEDAPVCQCTADFGGETCGVSICKDYCFQGNCSVSAEGQTICSCTEGYSGERCEVNACHKHCLNNGVCSLNEEGEPVCECTADYEGERCDVATTHTVVHTDNTTQYALRDLRRQVRQVIKEELTRAQRFFSDKIYEYEVNI